MKNKLCGIGEALIDFIPEVKGQRLKDVPSFKRVAGGAPANVVGAVTKLGIPSKFLTKLGDDPFGDYIVEVLDEAGIDTSNIARDKEGETALRPEYCFPEDAFFRRQPEHWQRYLQRALTKPAERLRRIRRG